MGGEAHLKNAPRWKQFFFWNFSILSYQEKNSDETRASGLIKNVELTVAVEIMVVGKKNKS